MFAALASVVYQMICPPGLQAEGLFYRNPGPPVSHSGGLLEDGVGVEVSFNRYAHRTQREGAGTVQRSRKSTGRGVELCALYIPLCHCLIPAPPTDSLWMSLIVLYCFCSAQRRYKRTKNRI